MIKIPLTRAQARHAAQYAAAMVAAMDEETRADLGADRARFGLDWGEATEEFWAELQVVIKDEARFGDLNEATRRALFGAVVRIAEVPGGEE